MLHLFCNNRFKY